MMSAQYHDQVSLLLRVTPYVAKEEVFGLKGGTAINLFMRDFPRLSIDLDLVYLPFDSREAALSNISKALRRIKKDLEDNILDLHVRSIPATNNQDVKLICQQKRAQVKVEVNTVVRGHLNPTKLKSLSEKAQEEFGQFVAIHTLSEGEVYGSKICAALDRQHPRDLFDVKLLLDQEGLSDEVRRGFLCSLLSHPRPIHEILNPAPINQKDTFVSQFQGMSSMEFGYKDHEETFTRLTKGIEGLLTDHDKEFLKSFKSGSPNWDLLPEYRELQKMPSVQWKLLNIQKLHKNNATKHEHMFDRLEQKLR